MGLMAQIVYGSLLLGICAVIHVGMIAASIPLFPKVATFMQRHLPKLTVGALIILAFFWIVLSHSIQVWIWAGVLMHLEIFEDLATAIYFTMVTYTTLGYGDITLAEGARNFAAFAAMTGILTFGVSTAFLVALVNRILPLDNIS